MWNLIQIDNFFTLVREFDSIDLRKIETRIDQNSPINKNTNVVTVRIDGKVDIPYVHHHVDVNCLDMT